MCESICLRKFEKEGKSEKREKEFSLPQACSCGSAVSDTPGRGEEREGGGSVSVDCGVERQMYNQLFELVLTQQLK